MVSYGGFYLSPTEWKEWLRAQDPPQKRYGAADAESVMDKMMREKNIRAYFGLDITPIPKSEPQERGYGLMIYRRKNQRRRVYLPPRDTSDTDHKAKQILKELLGLEVSDWRTLWFDHDPSVVDPDVEFLTGPVDQNQL
ncbi:hypothetical protein FRC08_004372 [Ceratobasidium sp. 394]|nr:hypothetical protein FRC08_004372 [Ceratobasidium sp. 394]KAG9084773.1 hypothetical protein FS749_004969 [Ceratobasidium sp. UAMH 11750]